MVGCCAMTNSCCNSVTVVGCLFLLVVVVAVAAVAAAAVAVSNYC